MAHPGRKPNALRRELGARPRWAPRLHRAGARGIETWIAWEVVLTIGIFTLGLTALVVVYWIRNH
jgi:hypothetical protein